MKKSFVALLLVLTIFPLTLTSCFFNAYHAKLDSDVQSYLDFDYANSLESFGTTGKGNVYLIEDESVFEKALPGYDSPVDFDKQIAILLVYESSHTDETYYIHSLTLDDGVLTVEVFHTAVYFPLVGSLTQAIPRCFLLTIDKISFDSIEFIDMRSGQHPH
ncbi:MAG: hypothetical protein IJW66_03060 [Clostridia bacterium]|nr:hypothetical protein [Clostridia bacterium]